MKTGDVQGENKEVCERQFEKVERFSSNVRVATTDLRGKRVREKVDNFSRLVDDVRYLGKDTPTDSGYEKCLYDLWGDGTPCVRNCRD